MINRFIHFSFVASQTHHHGTVVTVTTVE